MRPACWRITSATNWITGRTAIISVTGNPTAGHTQTDGVAVIGNTLDMTGVKGTTGFDRSFVYSDGNGA